MATTEALLGARKSMTTDDVGVVNSRFGSQSSSNEPIRRRRASTVPLRPSVPMFRPRSKQGAQPFEPHSVWAAPAAGTKAAERAVKAKQSNDTPLPPLSNHWTRHLLTEMMGNFVSTTLFSGVVIQLFATVKTAAILNVPVLSENAPFQQSVAFQQPNLYLALTIGLAYSLGLLTAPETKLNPVFTIAMSIFGLSSWSIVLPSVVGQLLGVLLSNFVVYFMAKDLSIWSPGDMQAAVVFGVTYPTPVPTGFVPRPGALDPSAAQPDIVDGSTILRPAFPLDENTTMYFQLEVVDNYAAYLSTMVFSAMLVLVIIPLFTAQQLSHAANAFGFGLIVAGFVAAGNGLGVASNPALWIGGAISCLFIGYDFSGPLGIFTYMNSYSVVAITAPFVGAMLGGFILELYGFAIFFPPEAWSCPDHLFVLGGKQDTPTADAESPDAEPAAYVRNPHERYALHTIGEDTEEEDEDDDPIF